MDKYKKYMDSAEPSPEFRERLEGLTAPKKAPVWQKYGAMAAALVLVLGLGAWGVSRMDDAGGRQEIGEPEPQLGEAVAPAHMPDGLLESEQTATFGGYEVITGEAASYYMLPLIEYGKAQGQMQADIALPVGVYRRDLTEEELLELLGGEQAVEQHLNWAGYEIYAYAMLHRDGSLWMLGISGLKGDTGLEHFSLEIMPGELPPSCLFYSESRLNHIWGVDVMASSYDGDGASSRRVSFLHEGYGFRFRIVGADVTAIEELTARAVRFILLHEEPSGGSSSEEMNTAPYDPTSGSANSAETRSPAPSEPPEAEEAVGVRIFAETVTPTGMTLVLERTAEGGQCTTGTPFRLERWGNGSWAELETIPYEGEGVLAWTDIAWLFPDEVGSRYEHTVSWSLLYGELDPGQYRMVKEVFAPGGETLLYAEFEIEN